MIDSPPEPAATGPAPEPAATGRPAQHFAKRRPRHLAPAAATRRPAQHFARRRPRHLAPAVRRPWEWMGLVAVCAAAAAMRAPAVGSGLPALPNPDEASNVAIGAHMADHLSWNPHHFAYPSMMYDVISAGRLVQHLAGHHPFRIATENLGVARTSDPQLFLGLRVVVVCLSIALCALVWFTVRWLTANVYAATAAGLTTALSPLMVANSVVVTPDTFSALFTAAAVGGALLVLRRGRRTDYWLAGAAAGWAAGAKYNAAAVAVSLVVAHVLRNGRGSLAPRCLLPLAQSGLAAVVAFVVTTPAAVLAPSQFVSGALGELHHYQTGHPGMAGFSVDFYLGALSRDGVMWLLALASALACVVGRWRHEAQVVAAFAAAYLVLISSQAVHFSRDLLPLLAALPIMAGLGVATAWELAGRLRPPAPALAALAIGGAVFAVPASASASTLGGPDLHSLAQAQSWVVSHIPRGSQIVVESYGPWIPPGAYRLVSPEFVVSAPVPPGTAAVVVTEGGTGRYLADPRAFPAQATAYRAFTRRWCSAARFDDGPWVQVFTPCRQPAGR